jgi:hypothetical protein
VVLHRVLRELLAELEVLVDVAAGDHGRGGVVVEAAHARLDRQAARVGRLHEEQVAHRVAVLAARHQAEQARAGLLGCALLAQREDIGTDAGGSLAERALAVAVADAVAVVVASAGTDGELDGSRARRKRAAQQPDAEELEAHHVQTERDPMDKGSTV